MKNARRRRRLTVFDIAIGLVLLLLTLTTLYPFLYIVSMSISSPDAVMRQEVVLLPIGFSLGSYGMVFENPEVWLAYANSIYYAVFGTMLNLFCTLTGAYALSRKEFSWGRTIMKLVTLTLIFSGGLIPTFLLVSSLGLYNTRASMIIPVAVNAWNLIIARSFFVSNIHDELPESARMDGAGEIRIFVRIVLPLSLAVIAVQTLFYAVFHWNAWFRASIYLSRVELQPLQLYLKKVLLMASPDMLLGVEDAFERVAYAMQLKYAVIVVAMLPILMVYPFVEKHFVKGVMLGAVKE